MSEDLNAYALAVEVQTLRQRLDNAERQNSAQLAAHKEMMGYRDDEITRLRAENEQLRGYVRLMLEHDVHAYDDSDGAYCQFDDDCTVRWLPEYRAYAHSSSCPVTTLRTLFGWTVQKQTILTSEEAGKE